MKTVFFDFDGTLTKDCLPTWININGILRRNGAEVTGELYQMFINEEIDYKEWCELTIAKLKKYNFLRSDFEEVARNIKLIGGVYETFETLRANGWRIQIVSGGITEIIRLALGDALKFVEKITANEVFFTEDGTLDKIYATEYDYKGKAVYIQNYINANKISPKDAVFVGNGSNDEWVFTTGAKTICVNPEDTDPNNKTIWHEAYVDIENIKTILPAILDKDILEKAN